MNKKQQIITTIGAFLIALCACQPKPLEITLPELDPKLVISSQIVPTPVSDSILLFVSVSKSFGALEYQDDGSGRDSTGTDTLGQDLLQKILVDSAIVTVTFNGKMDTLYDLGNGLYGAWPIPELTATTYYLHVIDTKTGMEVRSSAQLMSRVYFDTVHVKSRTSNQIDYLDVTYKFNDPPGENYYMLNYYGPLDTNSVSAFGYPQGDTRTGLISDREYPNGVIEEATSLQFFDDSVITVSVANISKAYYEYLQLRNKSNQSIGESFLSEPVSYPTNVDGGLGYFTLHFPDARTLQVP